MAHKRCDYCESKDCNGRCSRTALKIRIRRLLDLISALEEGERVMEQEIDRLVVAKREVGARVVEHLIEQWESSDYSSPGIDLGENPPA